MVLSGIDCLAIRNVLLISHSGSLIVPNGGGGDFLNNAYITDLYVNTTKSILKKWCRALSTLFIVT